MKKTRREFLEVVVTVSAGGALLGACGSEGGTDGATGCSTNVTIASNHNHSLRIPVADVEAGTNQTYDITGTATHGHQVTITASMFSMLQMGNTVMAGATPAPGDGHTHDCAIRCAG